jgi:hypothetical protein
MPKNDKSYISQVGAIAPAFALKALIGDLPRGSLEKAVEGKLGGSKKSLGKLLKGGLKGRGAGRALGAGLGIASAPVFLGGLKLLNSKNKKDQAKGLLMVGASAGAYQSVKGFTEAYREARVANMSKAKSAVEGVRLGGIRLGYKTPAALIMGLGIAAGRKKSRSKGGSISDKFLVPALTGAALGGISRGGEGFAKDLISKKGIHKSMKSVLPKVGGGVAGGLLGGLVLGGVIDSAMKSLEKKGSVSDLLSESDSAATHAMEKTSSVAMSVIKPMLELAAVHGATKGAMGYGRLGQTVGRSRIGKAAQKKMELAKQKQLAIGIREGIAGRVTIGGRSQLTMNIGVPELKLQRMMGNTLGKLVRRLPEEQQIQALTGTANFVKRNPGMRTTSRGESVAILNQLPGGISMALGTKKLPGNKFTNTLIYGGRGGLGKGLPKAGRQDAKSALSAANAVNLGTGALGLATVAGAGPLAGLGIIPSLVGTHMGMSGIKNLVTKTKKFKDMGLSEGAKGIRRAMLPGLRKTTGEKVGDKAVDYLLSPGARDYGRMIGGVSRGGVGALKNRAKGLAYQKYINRAASGERLSLKDALTTPVAAGTGIGALLNVRSKRNARKRVES